MVVPNNANSYEFPAEYLIHAPAAFKDEAIYKLVENFQVINAYITGILNITYDTGQTLLCQSISTSEH